MAILVMPIIVNIIITNNIHSVFIFTHEIHTHRRILQKPINLFWQGHRGLYFTWLFLTILEKDESPRGAYSRYFPRQLNASIKRQSSNNDLVSGLIYIVRYLFVSNRWDFHQYL